MLKRNSRIDLITLLCTVVTFFAFHSNAADDFSMSQIYPIDRGHSYVGFSIKYMGFAKVHGRFADFSGAFRYDTNDITKTSATVIIKVESIDTDHDFRDKDLRSANWFDAEKYPLIRFQSKRVLKNENGIEVIGDLTIKEITKEVALKLEYNSGVQKDTRGDTQVILTGSTTIDRKDFGVQGERWSMVKEGITAVESEIEIELSILGKQINAPNFRNWLGGPDSPRKTIYDIVAAEGATRGIAEFEKLRTAPDSKINENALNIVGYMLLKEGKVDAALEIFKHNAATYPDNTNLHDSLAEAYAVKGDLQNAITHYKKSLQLDPINANALEILRHLEK